MQCAVAYLENAFACCDLNSNANCKANHRNPS